MKRLTIHDVAERANVSISTVSRYLKNPASIKPVSAVLISKAIREMEYVPNPFAQNIRSEATNIIAMILPDISDRFFGEACKAVCTIFYENKYSVMICDTENDPEKERFYVDEMIKNRVAGILLVSSGKNIEYLKGIVKKWPHLMLFDRLELGVEADVVSEDNEYSGYILAKHMLEMGQRHFAILAGLESSVNMRLRMSGIEQALSEYGVSVEPQFLRRNLRTKQDASEAFEDLIQIDGCPRCVLACNTILLDGTVIAASRLGLAIPDDYSIAGFCVDQPRYQFPFPVSAVMQIPTELGMRAGELMLRRLKNNKEFMPKKLLLRINVV